MSKPTHRVEIVNPVATNIVDPWRTQGDYLREQREARVRHKMLIKQINASARMNCFVITGIVFSVLSSIASICLAIHTLNN